MNRHFGRVLFCIREHAEVGYYQRIDSGSRSGFKKFRQFFELGSIWNNIAGKINFNAVFMGKRHGFCKLIVRKILRRSTHTEARSAHIDRIRAVIYGGFQAFCISCRREDFRSYYIHCGTPFHR